MKKEEIEQILDKHLKLMVKNAEEKYYEFEEMKKLPEYKACLNAMLEVAEKAVNKNCNLQNVINWVEIEEKLPSAEGNFYLAWYCNCCISKAVWHGGSFTAVEQGWEDETPTHWAELPKPPCL